MTEVKNEEINPWNIRW